METKNTYIVQNMKLFSDYSLLQEITVKSSKVLFRFQY